MTKKQEKVLDAVITVVIVLIVAVTVVACAVIIENANTERHEIDLQRVVAAREHLTNQQRAERFELRHRLHRYPFAP